MIYPIAAPAGWSPASYDLELAGPLTLPDIAAGLGFSNRGRRPRISHRPRAQFNSPCSSATGWTPWAQVDVGALPLVPLSLRAWTFVQ